MRVDLLLPAVVALLVATGSALAQTRPQPAQPAQPAPRVPSAGSLVMQPVSNFRQNPLGERLGNGSEVDTGDWPASLIGRYRGADGKPYICSATLVGRRTLLTAAHCGSPNGEIAFTAGGRAHIADCVHPSPGYPDLRSADWALCLVRTPEGVSDVTFERISTAAAFVQRGSRLILTGYGCTTPDGGSDEKFRIGPGQLQWQPGDLPGDPHWAATRDGLATGDAFICQGDSGGPVLADTSAGRRIVAVTSHTDGVRPGVGYLSALSTPAARTFINNWSATFGQRICGVHSNATACR